MKKIKVGIIGTGNIGSDLLKKVIRSDYLECGIFTGRNPDSEGIKIAKKLGIKTSYESIKAIQDDPNSCQIVFDATSAAAHLLHAPILKKLNKFTIDLTPSRVGKMCIPVININDCLDKQNINMVTCGGQVAVPIIKAIKKIHPDMNYAEIVGSISSSSAGIGTRNNIDEYTQATRDAIETVGGVSNAKAIIILNPALPPINMHNTIYLKISNPDMKKIKKEVIKVINEIRKYVSGYKMTVEPIFDGKKVTLAIEVIGAGDFLPKYAGNLDIINAAAMIAAEAYAKMKMI